MEGFNLFRLARSGSDEDFEELSQQLNATTLDIEEDVDTDAVYEGQSRANIARAGQLQQIAYFLNRKNFQKYNGFHVAIFQRNFAAVKFFCGLPLDYGFDINAKCHGTPPLHLLLFVAALPNGLNFAHSSMKVLLENNRYDLSAKDDQGYRALHLACELDLAVAATLLLHAKNSADSLEAKDRIGNRPLHICAAKNSKESGNTNILYISIYIPNSLFFCSITTTFSICIIISKE